MREIWTTPVVSSRGVDQRLPVLDTEYSTRPLGPLSQTTRNEPLGAWAIAMAATNGLRLPASGIRCAAPNFAPLNLRTITRLPRPSPKSA